MRSDGFADRLVGEYRLEAQIGRGGMGVVFRARHEVSGEVVALKLMAPDLADNETFRERFVREAEAGPSLKHPNIVSVFETGEANGELFIAMELVEGTDLKGLIKQEGRLDPQRVLAIFRQAASALDAAHESGMVHRDVKPQNILVIPRDAPEGIDWVYLTDFGLVRPVSSETSTGRTGQVFGSVAYMAPELIEGIPADGRADVYALGCVLYECLTGKVPFERENEVSTVWAHIHEDPPLLTDTCKDLPGGLNDVVFKAMAKHPDDRFLTCGEFITELELGLGRKLSAMKYAYVRPLVARVPRRKTEREVWAPNYFPELSRVRSATRERLDWRKAAAFVAVLLLLSSVQVGREGGIPQAVSDVAEAADGVVDAVIAREPKNKDDARAVSAEDQGGLQRGDSGQAIAPADRKRLKALLPAGNKPRESGANESTGETPVVSHSGKIAYASGPVGALTGTQTTDIWVMDADGSNETGLTDTPSDDEFYPSWSPDGRHIAYVKMTNGGPQEIWMMDADGTNHRDAGLCPGDAACGKLAWSPDGRRVAYVQSTNLYVANLKTGTRRLLSDESKPASRPGGEGGPGPAWSHDGRSLAYTCRDALCVIAARGGEPRVIGPELTDLDWSPTGPWIVGEYWTDEGPSNIFVTRADGSHRRQLTQSFGGRQGARKPGWAPDGKSVVYTDWVAGIEGRSIWRMDVDGSNRVELTDGPDDYTPDWWGPPAT